jgi:photosystem II stability/assembly factor-like uncharacterized protein
MTARMSFVFSIAIGLALIPLSARAQGFRSVYSRDGADVWAVGDAGVYYRSFDGGLSWASGVIGGGSTLRGVVARNNMVIVVGDGGAVWRSTNSGGAWTSIAINGTPNLRAVEMASDQIGYMVGSGGAIYKTTSGGTSWSQQVSGTGLELRALRFTDISHGWAVGQGGIVLRTTDGINWSPVSIGTANTLLSVDQKGASVWAVGMEGTALRSTDGGSSWSPLSLKLDAHSDVDAVWLQTPDSVYIAGGGGFIRRSVNGGGSWFFPQHQMHGEITDMSFSAGVGWVCSSKNRIVMSTIDRGTTWRLPTQTVLTRSWIQKTVFSGNVRGLTFGINPVRKNTMYCALGAQVYRTQDEGETWTAISTIPDCNRINSFFVSPKDSSVMVAAVVGSNRHLVKTDDYGQTWMTTLTHDFGEYGYPLGYDPDHPDTVYFGGDSDGLYRSTNSGKNWARITNASFNFRSPCNVVPVPDSSNIILVGDGITGVGQGQLYRSIDGGVNFSLMNTRSAASEVPGMACGRLRNSVAFATDWANGGVTRTLDYGTTWNNVDNTGSTWGVDVCRDDPNCLIFGVYSGGYTYMSIDGGFSFISTPAVGSNYSFFARDRGCVLAAQSNGIYKMLFTYDYTPNNAQSVTVSAPNGGEVWNGGSIQNITWSAAKIAIAQIEYQRTPSDPWQLVAEVPGYKGIYAWSVPYDATTQARIRVHDAWDSNPEDLSDANFTIRAPVIAGTPSLDFGSHTIGTSTIIPVTIQNVGSLPLTVSSIGASSSAYYPNRTALTLAAGASDTVGVHFEPSIPGSYPDTLLVASNAHNQNPLRIALTGTALDTISVAVVVPNGGEQWVWNSVRNITWSSSGNAGNVALEYRTDPLGAWKPIAPSVMSTPGSNSYPWTVPLDTTSLAIVRVRDVSGGGDVSDAAFSLVAPMLVEQPNPLEMWVELVGVVRDDSLRLENAGGAPVVISSASSNNPSFWVGRSSLTIPPYSSDTLGVFFQPAADGPDSAIVTLVANDPTGTRTVKVTGSGTSNVAVDPSAPNRFALWQNRPNPFPISTEIRYSLPVRAPVTIEVYNLQGERVTTLVHANQGPGVFATLFAPGHSYGSGPRTAVLPAGVYFVRLQAGAFTGTRKMLLLR